MPFRIFPIADRRIIEDFDVTNLTARRFKSMLETER